MTFSDCTHHLDAYCLDNPS